MSLLTLPLRRASDVALAREKAAVAATLFGFDSVSQIRIATAASELARAIIERGKGGELSIERVAGDTPALILVFRSHAGQLMDPDASWDAVRAARLLADSLEVGAEAGWPVVARFLKRAPARLVLDDETLSAVLAEDSDGEAIGALTRQNRQLARLLDELRVTETTQRKKDAATGCFAHDLRSPLTAIFGALEQLEQGRLDPQQSRFLAIAQRAARSLKELTSNLQDSSMLDAGELTVERRRVALSEVVAAARSGVEPAAGHKSVTVAAVVPPDLTVDGDFARLTQIVTHLLSNAIKFSPAGGTVEVRGGCDGKRALLGVTDHGAGIAADQLGAIFDKLARATRGRGSAGERGTGLGLALSRQLAALHGGTLTVESSPGSGATFTLSLPPSA